MSLPGLLVLPATTRSLVFRSLCPPPTLNLSNHHTLSYSTFHLVRNSLATCLPVYPCFCTLLSFFLLELVHLLPDSLCIHAPQFRPCRRPATLHRTRVLLIANRQSPIALQNSGFLLVFCADYSNLASSRSGCGYGLLITDSVSNFARPLAKQIHH